MSNTADDPRDDETRDDAHDAAREENNRRGRRHGDPHANAKQETPAPATHLSATAVAGPVFAAPEPRMRDLSGDLMKMLPRSSGQMVRCRRIVGDHYRCNWWGSQGESAHDNAGLSGVMITRYRVVKSRMLRATVTPEGVSVDADGEQ